MRMTRLIAGLSTLALSVGLTAPTYAAADGDTYPNRSIRLLIGFPPGQAIDGVARFYAAKLGEKLGQSVIVENRAGAAGIIAHEAVKNADKDGYTLLMTSGATLAINPALYKNLSYDAVKDFTPIILTNTTPMFLATAADVPVKTYAEMQEYVKARPKELAYGSGGSGLTQHIAMEMLKERTGMDLLHVPYKGSPAMVTDLIGGRVQFAFDTSTSILPHATGKRVRLLGVTSLERSPAAPDVPTLHEQGVENFEALTWAAIVGPAGIPDAAVTRINTAMNEVLADPATATFLKSVGATPSGGTPAEFAAFRDKELEMWGKAVKASGARVD